MRTLAIPLLSAAFPKSASRLVVHGTAEKAISFQIITIDSFDTHVFTYITYSVLTLLSLKVPGRYVNKEPIYCLYFIEGVVIAAQCTATFSRSIVLPRIQVLLGREYAD